MYLCVWERDRKQAKEWLKPKNDNNFQTTDETFWHGECLLDKWLHMQYVKKRFKKEKHPEIRKYVKKQLLDNISLVFNVFKSTGHIKIVKVNLKLIMKMSKDVRGGKCKLKKSISNQIIHA